MKDDEVSIVLPPGFRFHPTDEEIITHYLVRKVEDSAGFSAIAIGEADMNKSEPWDLPSKAKMGEEEWYFFYERDRKYPTGSRTNRATLSGYWKATGRDKEINSNSNIAVIVGMKKTLVFYKGRAPKGLRTNWIMHEFRLQHRPNSDYRDDQWAVCRVFNKRDAKKNLPPPLPNDVIMPGKTHTGAGATQSSSSSSSYNDYNQYYYPMDYSNLDAYFQQHNPTPNRQLFNDLNEYSGHNHGGFSQPTPTTTSGMIRRHCKADQYRYSLPEELMGGNSSTSAATITDYYVGADGHVSSISPAPAMDISLRFLLRNTVGDNMMDFSFRKSSKSRYLNLYGKPKAIFIYLD